MFKQSDFKWTFFSGLMIVFVLTMEVMFLVKAPWVADYWEHRAVLYELIKNISNPSHPIVDSSASHAFFSPYMVGLAAVARFFSMTAGSILNIISIFNICFFFFSIWLICKIFFKENGKNRYFFFLTIIFLFYWGILPPYFSSFYHFITLPYVAAYPSTFAFGCSVISAFVFSGLISKRKGAYSMIIPIVGIMFLNWVVIITHPLTFLFTISMYLFLSLRVFLNNKNRNLPLATGLIFAIVILIFIPLYFSLNWPYFPMRDLINGVEMKHQFHTEGKVLYRDLVRSYFPMLLPLGIMVVSFFHRKQESLPWLVTVFFLLAIYCYGFFSEQFGLGRSASFLVIWLQIYLLHQIISIKTLQIKKIVSFSAILIALPFFFISNKIVMATAFRNEHPEKSSTKFLIEKLSFFSNKFRDKDVVLTDNAIGRYVPAFGAKIIANPYTGYWLIDNEERLENLNCFFSQQTIREERIVILKKYRPTHLLLTSANLYLTRDISCFIDSSETIQREGYYLFKLKFANE